MLTKWSSLLLQEDTVHSSEFSLQGPLMLFIAYNINKAQDPHWQRLLYPHRHCTYSIYCILNTVNFCTSMGNIFARFCTEPLILKLFSSFILKLLYCTSLLKYFVIFSLYFFLFYIHISWLFSYYVCSYAPKHQCKLRVCENLAINWVF